ncbi:MAG: hypothetical protein MJZ12_05185 [Prevotella sp.]|nr:hypothetical protein [Prevotella sp.]
MRQLNTIQNYIFLIGALMMVVGTGCVVFGIFIHSMSIVFCIGAISFSLMQLSQTYEGNNTTIKRLRSLMTIGDICFMLSGIMMIESVYHLIFPYMAASIDGYNFYVHYIHNNWVILLLIGAVFEIYTTNRISYELKKQDEMSKKS